LSALEFEGDTFKSQQNSNSKFHLIPKICPLETGIPLKLFKLKQIGAFHTILTQQLD
jgi:hypothetical protein